MPAHGQILGRAANLIFDIGSNVEVNEADLGTWLTSFFGGGGSPPPCSVPVILNPSFNGTGKILMQSGGSCITIRFGPFNLQPDVTGGEIVGVYDASVVQPAGTCRIFTVTNPNGQMSNSVTLCR